MSDSSPNDMARALDGASAVDRDAKIEQLLLTGLDHYFAAQYEQAINVWTRALFLDRSHARARAYIERARSAMAERQRESEEQEALAVADRGDRAEAPAPVAAPSRIERVRHGLSVSPRQVAKRRKGRAVGVAVTVLIVALGGYAGLSSSTLDWQSLVALVDAPGPAPAAPVAHETALPLPRRGEMALTRARALAASGHLRDALAQLDEVRPTDPQRADADRLRADVQRQLLAVIDRP